MRLGLLGGSFDPVHYGHLLLAESCREQARLDAIWFLPAAVPPHKQGDRLTDAPQRIEMLDLAIAGHAALAISRHETDRGGVNFTVDTLAHFRREDPQIELFFLLGADMLLDLPNWHQPERICELATPVMVRRSGVAEPDLDCLGQIATPDQIQQIRRHQVEMPELGISSTEIRRRVAAGRSIRYLTPRAVEEYIQTRRLYLQP